jgi:hypothetical protein
MGMTTIAAKSKLLEDAGYAYSFDRMIYINRKAKKVFSVEFVEDNSPEALQKCIVDTHAGDWQFFFQSEPSETVKRELVSVLG